MQTIEAQAPMAISAESSDDAASSGKWAWNVGARIESVLGGLRDGVTVHDTNGRLLYANGAAQRYGLGRRSDGEGGPKVVFRGEDRNVIADSQLPFLIVFESGGSVEQVICCDVEGGTGCVWFRVASSLVEHEGAPEAGVALSIWYDVTDLREANDALRLHASIMEAQREASPSGLLVIDAQDKLLFWNRRFLQYFGLPEELMASCSGRAVFAAVVRLLKNPQRFERAVARVLRASERKIHDVELELIDGRIFDLHSAPVRGRDDHFYGRAWFVRDISERKRAERDERALIIERSARAAAENATRRFEFLGRASQVLARPVQDPPDLAGIAELCANWEGELCIVDVFQDEELRRAARGRPGPAAEAAKSMQAALTDESGYARIRKMLLRGVPGVMSTGRLDEEEAALGSLSASDLARLTEAGLRGFVSVRLRSRTGVRALFTLVTKAEPDYEVLRLVREVANRLELALDNAKLMRDVRASLSLRDEFLDIAAHELRTPLTTLLLTAQLTQSQLQKGAVSADAWVRERSTLLVRQAQRLMRLVTRLLDATRMSAGSLKLEVEPFDLAQVVQDIAAQFAEEAAKIGATVKVETKPSMCRADRGRVEQVVQNLLTNALKYGGGSPVALFVDSDGREVRLVVEDKGPGIPEHEHARIFERYVRGSEASPMAPGLGLGLYLSKQIVEAHGGALTVESAPGKGSRFVARLPGDPDRPRRSPTVH